MSYKVTVPANARLELTGNNSRLKADGLRGHVKAMVVNGGIELTAMRGTIDSAAVNASVTVKMAEVTGPVRLESTNGRISLEIPKTAKATLNARSVNGGITVSGLQPQTKRREGESARSNRSSTAAVPNRRSRYQRSYLDYGSRESRIRESSESRVQSSSMNEDKATRYHRLGRRAGILSTVWSGVMLSGLLLTGASVWLRAGPLVRRAESPFVTALYVLVLSIAFDAATLPFSFYRGFLLERRYGLSTETIRHWLKDHAKAVLIGVLFAECAAQFVYLVLRHGRRHGGRSRAAGTPSWRSRSRTSRPSYFCRCSSRSSRSRRTRCAIA